MAHRFLISQDSPVLYITIVTKNRLPVFQTDKLRVLVCRAIDEARRSAGFLLFAYVVMLDHLRAVIPFITRRRSEVVDGLLAIRWRMSRCC